MTNLLNQIVSDMTEMKDENNKINSKNNKQKPCILFVTQESKGYSGGIVGIGDNYKVTRCYVKAPEKSTVAKGKYGIDCSSGQAGGLIGNSKDLTLERCFWYSSCAKVAWGQYSLSGTHSGNDYDYYYYQVRFKNPDNFPTYDFKNVWYIDTTSGADAPGLLFETKLTVSDVANTGGQGGTGAVGMGLFDLISGWVLWAPFTFVIVGLMGYAVGKITENKKSVSRYTLAFAVALVIKIVGYYVAEWLIYGNIVAPLQSVPGNIIQIVFASILVLIAIKPLEIAAKRVGVRYV